MRLLLAEDERSLARALTVLLRKNNYEVDAVYDGEEAMAYLGSGNYDGAILDIMMPKRDGIDVLCQLRRQGNRLPVLLLTAKSEVDDKVLELLMCNPRNLISTERFLEKIWGYDNEAEINVVWVYISYLRKKLAALHGNIQIKARRNAGYYLEETI